MEMQAWEMANSMVYSQIPNFTSLKLRMSMTYVYIAKLMWENLKKHYAVSNAPKNTPSRVQVRRVGSCRILLKTYGLMK